MIKLEVLEERYASTVKGLFDVVELGLSLSTAEVVKTLPSNLGGQTT